MKVSFAKNKYQRELLIDCFRRNAFFKRVDYHQPFFVTFYEIIFIVEGRGEFKLDHEVIPFKPGTVLLLPPNKWRQWCQTEANYSAIYLIFEEEFISNFFNDALYLYRFHYFYNINSPSYLQLSEEELPDFIQTLTEVQQEIKQLQPDSSHLLRALLYYLLIRLNRVYQAQTGQEKSFYQEPIILRFRKLLEAHIHEKQRVREYADLLGISTSRLNKLLRLYFGKSASEVIKDRLVLAIKKELLFSDKTIAEIGYELGFSEPSNFNRFFKSMTQMPPHEYRLEQSK
ncbi:MAG: AraC family transcriptional regulator [Bacteroidota bacterium]